MALPPSGPLFRLVFGRAFLVLCVVVVVLVSLFAVAPVGLFWSVVVLPAFLRLSSSAFVCCFLCCGVSPRFCFVCGLSCRLLVFRFCGAVALPPHLFLPPPSRLFLCGVLVQSCAGPSLWVSGCFMRRPGCLALMPGVWLCSASSLHSVSWQQRPFGPVWGFVYPLHHGAFVVVVHCAPALRYSSSDDPGPPIGHH